MLGYLPGALIFRLPGRSRAYRAGLPADERLFWSVILSVVWSVSWVLVLALLGRYSLTRLISITLICSGLLIVGLRQRVAWPTRAARPSWHVLVPIGIVALGVWLYFPSSEYVIGGKDPGVYLVEGIQIAQRGSLVTHDDVIASVPAPFRDLFFPSYHNPWYYSLRFMGFFIDDPASGTVTGQFPHLFPASIAIGYGLNGLSGARQTVGVWAVLGLLAVYFVGARLFGRPAAAAGVLLLAINVAEVWFARYPNSELVMQTLLLAAILAFARTLEGARGFFGIVAGVLLGLMLFLRYDVVLAFAAFGAAATLATADRRHVGMAFPVALALTAGAGFWYLMGPMRAYAAYPLGFTRDQGGVWLVAGAGVAAGAARFALRRDGIAARVRQLVPIAIAVVLVVLAGYAYFVRQMAGRIALGDAMAFRAFGWYVNPWVLGAAVAAGAGLLVRRFWRDPAFFLTFAAFTVFFFYKTRIVPEHFWTARRFLAIALPGTLLFIGGGAAAVAGPTRVRWLVGRFRGSATPLSRRHDRLVAATGCCLMAAVIAPVAIAYWHANAPLRHYVEYAGLIPRIERLAGRIGDRDLLIVESRDAGSDLHVFAQPLAYIYARHVLVLSSAAPPKDVFESFVAWARTRYAQVLFLGGGGSDLLTRQMAAEPVSSDRFQVPEYDAPLNAYPAGVKSKEFEYGLYRLVPATGPEGPVNVAVGGLDDLDVVRFHARERRGDTGMTFRWTRGQSFVLLLGITRETRQIIVWMSNGGRPPQAPVPTVEVAFDGQVLGTATPVDEVRPYTFALPPELAARAAAARDPARLRLRVPTWNPSALLGLTDTRDLGVIVTRVEAR